MASNALKRLTGRIAIVTASTQGIGFAIAQRLAQEGAKVIISSRKQNNVDGAMKSLKNENLDVTSLVCNVSKADDRKKLFEEARRVGGLDILVSNAAVNPAVRTAVLDCTERQWDKIFDVNVKSSYMLAKEALPLLRQSKAGRIIFISTIGGFQLNDFLGAYGVSKTALLGLSKAAAAQLAKENITVNAVAPGLIQTNFSKSITSNEQALKRALSDIPMKRVGQPNEISGIIAYLASDDGSYVTGENIVIAGGMTTRL